MIFHISCSAEEQRWGFEHGSTMLDFVDSAAEG